MKALAAAGALHLSAAAPNLAHADEPAGGHLIFEARLRAEFVDQAGFASNAQAVTLRTRLGYETPAFHGFKALVEGENIVALSDSYNSTTNGHVTYPSVPDPELTEINRAQVSWSSARFDAIAGRQRIVLGNARFVGNSGFRQNEQTFDAVRLIARPTSIFTATYIYVAKVRRIFGDDHPQGVFDSDSHIVQAEARTPIGQVSAYAYLLDFSNAPSLSTATFGARLTGARPLGGGLSVTYEAEYARQGDYGSNPSSYDVDYVAASLGLRRGPSSASVGLERLSGDGVHAFQTPLASLHPFQGWADVFLTTPAGGVRDLNLRASTTVNVGHPAHALRILAAAHDFTSDDGDVRYGREANLSLQIPIIRRLSAELTGAWFDGQGAFADRNKVWVTLECRY